MVTSTNSRVRYNPVTATYDTPDGTFVPSELVDNAQCLADVFNIARIRHDQRSAKEYRDESTVQTNR